MYKLCMLVLAASAALSAATLPAAAEDIWMKGMAAGLDTIYVTVQTLGKDNVEQILKDDCAREYEGNCHSVRIVPLSHYLVGIHCTDENSYNDTNFVGSSTKSVEDAFRMLMHPEGEAGQYYDAELCVILASSGPVNPPPEGEDPAQ